MARKTYEVNMTVGPLAKSIAVFVLPLMLSNLLQLLYNAADIVVAGRFAGKEALAAVGSTGSLISFITNLFIGLSVGTCVVVSRYYGARDWKRVSRTVHTSVALSLLGGVICTVIGLCCAEAALRLIHTPEDVFRGATLYIRIFFLGAPASMFYNFGAAVLRGVGDTKRPLYCLAVSGLVNVCLNLVLVIGCHLGVAGVAIATVVSQYLSAVLLGGCLLRARASYRVFPQRLRLHGQEMLRILQIGLPAGIHSCVFDISNIIIQSSVNSFGSTVMAGVTAASNIEGFVYTAMNAVAQASMTATAQNIGAKQEKRIYASLRISLLYVLAVGLIMGGLAVLCRNGLLRLYSSDPAVIAAGAGRMMIVCASQVLCGIMDVVVGHLRGLGHSLLSTGVSVVGVCGIRITWLVTVFAAHRTPAVLFLAWPVSWAVTALVQYLSVLAVRRRAIRRVLRPVQ